MGALSLNLNLLLSGTTALFSPLELGTDLLRWYDATDAASITNAGGGRVSAWADKSGNNVGLSQSTGSARPTWNGVDAIDANGTSEYLFNNTPFMYNRGSVMVSGVFKSNAPLSGRSLFGEGRSTNGNPIYQGMHNFASGGGDDNVYNFIRNDANVASVLNTTPLGTTFFDDTYRVFNWIDTGSLITIVNNGVGGSSPITYSRSGVLTLDRFAVFALVRNTIGNFMPGSLKELVITSVLPDTKINKLNAYLARKHGV